jgi:NAD(P)-dependent dehydrogenase (short-subunit alcohol dehydrogenase family)/mannose-6-phosphate isomerase-like protein (cupin superfamily)
MLAGKKVVVVGGSSGIGLSTAELATREGADVIIASRNADRLNAAASTLGAKAMPTDVTSDESVENLFRSCGPVDHVVVTAAQLRTGPFKTVSMEDVRATMEAKFWGAWRVARSAEIRPGGSLTLVSGYLSIRPRPNSAIISVANGALESLTRALALELAPVRCNAVSPGIIDTPIRAAMPEAARRDMLAKTAASLPVGRVFRRRYRPPDSRLHDHRLCDGIDRLSRRGRVGYLRGATTMASEHGAFIRNIAEVPWREFPNHFGGALSKPLVMPETAGSRHLDYRISMYQPMAHVARHKHQVQEQIYHVLEGEGLMEIAGKNHVVRKHDFIFLPPGVEHAISNSGLVDLVFLVITSPVTDDGKIV